MSVGCGDCYYEWYSTLLVRKDDLTDWSKCLVVDQF